MVHWSSGLSIWSSNWDSRVCYVRSNNDQNIETNSSFASQIHHQRFPIHTHSHTLTHTHTHTHFSQKKRERDVSTVFVCHSSRTLTGHFKTIFFFKILPFLRFRVSVSASFFDGTLTNVETS